MQSVNELSVIRAALERLGRRSRWLRVWRGFWQGLLAGGLVFLATLALYKVVPIPTWLVPAAAAVGAGATLAWALVNGLRRVPLLQLACWVDERLQLKERLSTALELAQRSEAGDWARLLIADAAQHAAGLDPRRLLPWGLPKIGRWTLLVLAACAGLGFVPTYRSAAHVQRQRDAAHIRDTGQQLAEVVRQELRQRPPNLPPTQKALEQVVELGDRLGRATLTRGEALRELSNLAQQLSQQARQLTEQPALKPLEQAAREPPGSRAGQSLDKLQRQMADLQKALGSAAGQSDKLAQLQQQLQQVRQALSQLQSGASGSRPSADQLARALSEAAQQARDLGQTLAGLDEAIKALENNQTDLALQQLDAALTDLGKLRALAQSLQQLQQEAARLGKDLAEQLEKGQLTAAISTLRRMIELLKAAELTAEQQQKLMDEVRRALGPGSKYGQVADHFKQALQQMQQGQKPAAAESLAAAARELEELLKQAQDCEGLLAALDALDRAQAAISSGRSWSQAKAGGRCSACGGLGCGRCKGRGWGPGGRPGAGVGTWADELEGWVQWEETGPVDNSGVQRPDMAPRGLTERPTDLSPNLTPDKVRGQLSPGGQMPSITLKGVGIKGQSTVEYEAAAAAAQAEAQSALNQDKVPRAYQNAVRQYFDELK